MSFPERPSLGAAPGLGAFLAPGQSSFTDLVHATAPHLLPGRVPEGLPPRTIVGGGGAAAGLDVPHGTTIVALKFADGVMIAGDRRGTSGNVIAQRDMEKVFISDSYSAVGIAGTAGVALQMVRLFSVDLEHYEKTEGVPLSFDGKANKLAGMVQQNLGAALQGFVVVPLFVGFDTDADDPATAGRIVTYDPVGGRYDEHLGFHSVGSGSVYARGALKKTHDSAADLETSIRTAVEALYDAADDDTATGGPDVTRGLYPVVISITGADGAVRRPEEEIEAIAREVIAGRTEKPGG
jgi:proteasome beta subunit